MTRAIGFPTAHTATTAWARRREQPVFGRNGMVASAHPLVTAAGLGALARGANAVDAAVCAGLVAAVVMPEMCGFGGDLFAVVHMPPSNHQGRAETIAIHGSGIAPRGATLEQMREHGEDGGRLMPYRGPLAVAVPGMPDAYAALLTRFGSRSLAEMAAPAIAYAAEGYPLTASGAEAIRDNADLLRRFPSSAAVFLSGGRIPKTGEMLRQPDLGRTLAAYATGGADLFYRGEIARRIARFMTEAGGALSADDLADHQTELTVPLTTTYRGQTVHQTGLPTQGLILLEALNIVERADLRTLGIDSAAGVHLLVEAKKLAYADRLAYAADPAFYETPLDRLLSKEWARCRFDAVRPDRAAEETPPGGLTGGDTTSLCVADGTGMMVSLIQSVSSAFGSGVVAGDTGVVLNNRAGRGFSLEDGHPNQFAPGKKTMHTLNCYLITALDGSPIVAGGTPGGDGQPQWNLQTIAALIDADLDAQAAVELPRWTSWPGTDPDTLPNRYELRLEDRFEPGVIGELQTRGHIARQLGPWGAGGAAQVICRDPDTGALVAGSDPRAEGLALGF